jgi:hypothetical protein
VAGVGNREQAGGVSRLAVLSLPSDAADPKNGTTGEARIYFSRQLCYDKHRAIAAIEKLLMRFL